MIAKHEVALLCDDSKDNFTSFEFISEPMSVHQLPEDEIIWKKVMGVIGSRASLYE